MILTKLTLTDFGVFGGQQSIALCPKARRPVVLFGGKNGAGKSSILEALRLCLYGPAAYRLRASKEEYLHYLSARIHRNPASLIQPTFASISAEFQYGHPDGPATYTVTRSWEVRGGGKPTEYLAVERNGSPLDKTGTEHWQDFVQELIPIGVSQLFFFDGEKIQHLAEDTSDQATLSDAIKSLLGLDIVERLQVDLGLYLSRQVKLVHGRALRREAEGLETAISELQGQLGVAKDLREKQERVMQDLGAKASQLEGHLAAQGGAFARQREQLVERQAALREQIRRLESDVRELCGKLLPFALAPHLCVQLRERLVREEQALQFGVGQELLDSIKREWLRRARAAETWSDIPGISPNLREQIYACLERALSESSKHGNEASEEPLHELSGPLRRQILVWVDQATAEVPAMARAMGAGLERAYRELAKVEEGLRKIPADEVLKPLLDGLHLLHEKQVRAGNVALRQDEEIRRLESELGEKKRRYKKLVDTLATEANKNKRIRLVPKVQSVLEEYKTALLGRKVSQLQGAVTECFNLLCRKKDALRSIRVNPVDFSVTLYDRHNRPLPKDQLSAGEKQIYAISMLWALGKTSGRPLPIVVDTPLARLDSDHRKLLVQHYFPVASHQVLILSTDTELDQFYFHELQRAVAHAYQLEFDPTESRTVVHGGYFWKERDETHQAAAH